MSDKNSVRTRRGPFDTRSSIPIPVGSHGRLSLICIADR
jgi:hypothetical protein